MSIEPADDRPETAQATEIARDHYERLYLNPVFGRPYPESVCTFFQNAGAELPIRDGDMEIIAAPIDYLGVNNYSRFRIEAAPAEAAAFRISKPTLPMLAMPYEAAPHSLGEVVRWISDEYDNPRIYVTENGVCDNAEPISGKVDDTIRLDVLRGFLTGLHGAIQDGIEVGGYYLWSLFDNFEWSLGYSVRFGIIHTDLATQRRTSKASVRFYSEVITRNGVDAADSMTVPGI